MRIAALAVLLFLLLVPSLGLSAADPLQFPLLATTAAPLAIGNAWLEPWNQDYWLTVEVNGLPPGRAGNRPSYVVQVVESERSAITLGALPADEQGHARATFGPLVVQPADLTLVIAARPVEVVLLTSQQPSTAASLTKPLRYRFGPEPFAPILPAALGLTLLRRARRIGLG